MIAIDNCVAVDLLGAAVLRVLREAAHFQHRRILPVCQLLRHVQGRQGRGLA